jgi:arylsulfatase
MNHYFPVFSGRDLPYIFIVMVLLLVFLFALVFALNRFGKSHKTVARNYLLVPLMVTLLVVLISSLMNRGIYEAPEETILASASQPNFVVMIFDALRADHVGAIASKYNLTPVMDNLTDQGQVYKNCYAIGSWTFPSTIAILTSRLPNKLGLLARNRIPDNVVAFPGIMRDHGYYTAGLSTNTYFHPREGFQHFFDEFKLYLGNIQKQLLLPFDSFFPNPPHLRELAYQFDFISTDYQAGSWKQVNREAYNLVQDTDNKPFLLYLHYMETHAPYRANPFDYGLLDMTSLAYPSLPIPLVEAYKQDAEPRIAEILRLQHMRYQDCVRAADQTVEDMLDMLQSMGIADRTILVLTSDHGEEFYEHNAWKHGTSLFNEQIHIPLIFHIPEDLELSLPENQGSTTFMDIAPTVLDLAGIDENMPDTDGWSLTQTYPDSNRPVYAVMATERKLLSSVIVDPYKLIMIENEVTGQIDTLLYDLATDPSESINIHGENRVLADSLAILVQVQLDQSIEPPAGKASRLSFEELQRLRALGYIN